MPLLDLLLPPRCGSCRRVGTWLCSACRGRMRALQEPLCPRCGAELESQSSCACSTRLRHLARLRAAAAYEGPLERSIHRFKYEAWSALASPLATLLAEQLAVEGSPATLLVPVPLHPRRQSERGYNQSELLARELARILRIRPPIAGLKRVRDTPPQVGLDRLRRRQNMAAAFIWTGPRLNREPVLLIDDVATTGATLESCASVLRTAGSGPVTGLVLARVRL